MKMKQTKSYNYLRITKIFKISRKKSKEDYLLNYKKYGAQNNI